LISFASACPGDATNQKIETLTNHSSQRGVAKLVANADETLSVQEAVTVLLVSYNQTAIAERA
jgi:hypothetical protein